MLVGITVYRFILTEQLDELIIYILSCIIEEENQTEKSEVGGL